MYSLPLLTDAHIVLQQGKLHLPILHTALGQFGKVKGRIATYLANGQGRLGHCPDC